MKKLHYMAVFFQMFHVGIIRNRISKILMSVSLQVTLNCLCHGSSVRTQHISKEQLDMKQLYKTSVAALSRSACKPSGVKHKFQNLIRFDTSRTGTVLQSLTFASISGEISFVTFIESRYRSLGLHRMSSSQRVRTPSATIAADVIYGVQTIDVGP